MHLYIYMLERGEIEFESFWYKTIQRTRVMCYYN